MIRLISTQILNDSSTVAAARRSTIIQTRKRILKSLPQISKKHHPLNFDSTFLPRPEMGQASPLLRSTPTKPPLLTAKRRVRPPLRDSRDKSANIKSIRKNNRPKKIYPLQKRKTMTQKTSKLLRSKMNLNFMLSVYRLVLRLTKDREDLSRRIFSSVRKNEKSLKS